MASKHYACVFIAFIAVAVSYGQIVHRQNSNQISGISGMGSISTTDSPPTGESIPENSFILESPPGSGSSPTLPPPGAGSSPGPIFGSVASSGDSNAGGHNVLNKALQYAQIAKPPDYFSFCLALVSCSVAFLILTYSIQLQEMATKGQEAAPDARFGIGWSYLLALVIMAVYFLYWLSRHQGETFCEAGFDLTPAVQSPQDFAPAFFLAAIAPGILALFKFTFIIPFMQSRQSETPGATRFPFSALLGILLTLTTLAANIAKLLESFHQQK